MENENSQDQSDAIDQDNKHPLNRRKKVALAVIVALSLALVIPSSRSVVLSLVDGAFGVWANRSSIAGRFLVHLNPEEKEKSRKQLDPALSSGDQVPHQWFGDRGRFVLVLDLPLDYYENPSPSSSIRGTLKPYMRVRAIQEKSVMIDKETKEPWVLVSDERGKHYVGWVPKSGLVFKNQFKRKKSWEYGDIHYYKGHVFGTFETRVNGSFTLLWKAKGHGLELEDFGHGHFFEYGDILWAKRHPFTGWEDFFIIDSNDEFHHEYRFREDGLKVETLLEVDDR